MNSELSGSTDSCTHGFWKLGPSDASVTIRNADALLAHLPYFLTGWNVSWAGLSVAADPDICIEEYSDGTYRVTSFGPSAADLSFENPYDAACGFAEELVRVHVTRDPCAICLCAGAVKIKDGLVVLVGDTFSDNRNVALHLGVLGHRFFGSDQIAVSMESPVIGTCLGLLPKVRLPLQGDCGVAFREFVEGYSSMQTEEMAYLKLWDGEAADFGESAAISALVLLDHTEDQQSSIELDWEFDMASKLASTVYAPHIGNADLIAGLKRISENIPSYHLRFTSSREAAALLSRELHRVGVGTYQD